jgi:hypothetical protein
MGRFLAAIIEFCKPDPQLDTFAAASFRQPENDASGLVVAAG